MNFKKTARAMLTVAAIYPYRWSYGCGLCARSETGDLTKERY